MPKRVYVRHIRANVFIRNFVFVVSRPIALWSSPNSYRHAEKFKKLDYEIKSKIIYGGWWRGLGCYQRSPFVVGIPIQHAHRLEKLQWSQFFSILLQGRKAVEWLGCWLLRSELLHCNTSRAVLSVSRTEGIPILMQTLPFFNHVLFGQVKNYYCQLSDNLCQN